VRVRNVTRGLSLGENVERADRFATRLLGLMFRRGLAEGEGLLIAPCKAVHTHFMRFAIDVLFVDASGRVVRFLPALQPWGQTPYVPEAAAVIELPAGAATGTEMGDQLSLQDG